MRFIYVSSQLAAPDARFFKHVADVAASPADALARLATRFPGRMVYVADHEVSLHAPSIDGASGALGYLGRCLGRIGR